MPILWRLQVLGVNGIAKPSLDLDDAVAGLESFSVDAAGSCGEASFTALPSAINVEPRDVITLQYSSTTSAAFQNVYRGVITSAGSTRAPTLQAYRAVGLKQRAYELRATDRKVPGGDVATVAGWVLSIYAGVVGGDYAIGIGTSPAFPPLGFTIGDRFPQLQSVGDFVDELVGMVGAFIVPAGQAYVYSGVTYTAGETVPPVRWGVNAAGIPFFVRPTGAPITFREDDRATRVVWRPRDAEQVSDRVVLVYASEYAEGTSRPWGPESAQAIGYPLAVTVGTGDLNAARMVVLANPIDYMADETANGVGSGDVMNVTNAFDGNVETYAVYGSLQTGRLTSGAGFSYDSDNEAKYGAIAEVTYTPNGNTRGTSEFNLRVIAILLAGGGAVAGILTMRTPPDGEGGLRTLYLPLLPLADVAATVMDVELRVDGAEDVQVHTIRIWLPDRLVAERIAQGFMQPIKDEVGQIEYQGLLLPTTTLATPASTRSKALVTMNETGEVVEVVVERFETSITTQQGVVTRVYVGQAFEADLEAERIVLERLAERVATRPVVRRGGTM